MFNKLAKMLLALSLVLVMSTQVMASSKRKAEEGGGGGVEEAEPRLTKLKASSSSDSIGKEESKEEKRDDNSSSVPTSPIMYSDTKPKSKCIFTLDLSGNTWKHDEAGKDVYGRRIFQIYNTTEEILKDNRFVSLLSYCTGEKKNSICGVFGRFVSEKLETSIVINYQYRNKSLSTCFDRTEFRVDDRINKPITKKWSIVKKEKTDTDDYVDVPCMELSWKWVDLVIHSINVFVYDYKSIEDRAKSEFTKHLYANINNKGLENSLIRLSVIANKQSHYSFNVIYETNVLS